MGDGGLAWRMTQTPPTAWDDPLEAADFTRFDTPSPGCAQSVLAVEGLHCAACAVTLEQALSRLPGVDSVQVNLATRRLRVAWQTARVRLSQLAQAATDAGYPVLPAHSLAAEGARQQAGKRLLWQFVVAGLCMMQVMMYTVPVYMAAPGEITPDVARLLGWAAWMLSLPVVLFSATPFFAGAWRSLRQGRAGMDVPVALGIAATFAASSYSAFAPQGLLGSETYFDSLTMFVFFLLGSRVLDQRARHHATAEIERITQRLPQAVERLEPDGSWRSVGTRRLQQGDEIRLQAGQAVPADGVLLDGPAEFDEAVLSGESRPCVRQRGEPVVCGSFNLGAVLRIRVTAVGEATRFGQISLLAQQVTTSKPVTPAHADRFAQGFVLGILALAALTAAAWSVVDPSRALWSAVAVLIVTCPCALSLAAPTALLSSAGALSRDGVLLAQPAALEALAGIDRVVFDKTGTLTQDTLQLTTCTPLRPEASAPVALAHAAGLAEHSAHPLARALAHAAREASLATPSFVQVREAAGQGLEGSDENAQVWRLGASAFAGGGASDSQRPAAVLANATGPLARFEFDEVLRPDAAQTVHALQAAGLKVSLLSGDGASSVQRIAGLCGIGDWQAEATPQDKLARLQAWQAEGERVAMVGDGLNDGPVLALANVAIAVGQAVPLSKAKADLILPGKRLMPLVLAWHKAHATRRVIRQNLAWALAYNLACVPLAMVGLLPPWLAGLGMAASSLFVVANSLRLRHEPVARARQPQFERATPAH